MRSILLSIFLCATSLAQIPTLSEPGVKSVPGEPFLSIEGGFRIGILKRHSGYEGLNPARTDSLGAGGLYPFNLPEADYQIGYINLNSSLSRAEIIERTRNLHVLILRRSVKGLEITESGTVERSTFDLRSSEVPLVAIRYVLTDERLYILIAKMRSPNASQAVKQVFDSLELIDSRALMERAVLEATPDLLPQSPPSRRLTNDLQNEGLKGPVRSVAEFREDLTGQSYSTGKRKSSEHFYNRNGNLLKSILYDYKGMPYTVRVYGFVKGKRVPKEGSITYAYNPPPMTMALMSDGEPVSEETQYDLIYEFKYDRLKRLIEISRRFAGLGLRSRTRFTYGSDTKTEIDFGSDGEEISRSVFTLDARGLPVDWKLKFSEVKELSEYQLAYDEFDKHGNWTRKRLKGVESDSYGLKREIDSVTYRVIEYH